MNAGSRPNPPNWVRWVLVFPAALGAGIVTNLGIKLLVATGSFIGLSNTGQYYLSQIIGGLAQPVAFVLAGAKVAPKHNFGVALVLTAFYAIVLTTVLTVGLGSTTNAAAMWAIAGASVLGVVATIVLSYRMHARGRAAAIPS